MTTSFDELNSKYGEFRDFLCGLHDDTCRPPADIDVIYNFASICSNEDLEKTINEGKAILKLEELPCKWIVLKVYRNPTEVNNPTDQDYRNWLMWLVAKLEEELKIKTGEVKLSKEERNRRKFALSTYRAVERLRDYYYLLWLMLTYFSADTLNPPVEGEYDVRMKEFIADRSHTDFVQETFKEGNKILKLKRFPATAISKVLARNFDTPELCKAWVENLLQLLKEEINKNTEN